MAIRKPKTEHANREESEHQAEQRKLHGGVIHPVTSSRKQKGEASADDIAMCAGRIRNPARGSAFQGYAN